MRPTRLILENFLSFESLDYFFVNSVVALIGLNKTDDGQGSNGSGKALSLDSDIMTMSGSIKMKDIKIGDKILGFNGKEQEVVAIAPQGVIDCYEVTFNDGTRVKCNEEHLWKVSSCYTPKNWKIKSLKEIMKQSIQCNCGASNPYRYRVPTVKKIEYNHKDVLINPYVLGCLLGDGTLGSKLQGYSKSYYSHDRTILLTSKDDEILNKFRNELPQGLYLKKGDNCNYRIEGSKENNCDSMMNLLKVYDLYLRDSETKFVPKEYIFNDQETRLEILRGLLDTDGYVNEKGLIEFAVISKQLIEDVAFIARSLGCLCHEIKKMKSGYKKDGIYIKCKDHYRLRIVPPKGLDLFHLSRKSERLMQLKKMNCVDRRITDIQYVGKEEMQCIQVSNEDGLFLTNNFIVTHNSSIQQAIYYAITGNNLRCALDKKLIRRGQDSAKIQLDIFCDKRQQSLSIIREISMKGSSKLSITINEEKVQYATVKDGNDFIMNWIAITSEDLKSYFIICKEYYKSFFRTSNTEKLALISRFINFSFLDKAKVTIETSISELNASKRLVENEKFKIEGQIELFEEQLMKEESRNLTEEKNNEIAKCEEAIKEYKRKIENCQEVIRANKTENSLIEKNLIEFRSHLKELEEKLNQFDIKELESGIEEIKKELEDVKKGQNESLQQQESIQKKRNDIRIALRKIQINLSGTITCPKCNHKFLTLKDTTLEDEQAKKLELDRQDKRYIAEENETSIALKEYEDVISEFLQIKSGVEEECEAVRCQIRKVQEEIYGVNSTIRVKEAQIERNEKNIDNSEFDIKEYQERIEDIEKRIKEIESKEEEINTKPIEENITKAEVEHQKKERLIKELDDKIFKKNEWINRFKDFKMYLASEQIKNIQNHANDILQKENSDLRLLIESFKKDSKGNIKDEITSYVVRDEAESFWYYSGGERARVEIATILAIQQMINSTNPYGGLEFLSIDEITEGLSEEGLYDIIEALNFIKYPILITTHVFNQNAKCETLKIVKEDGVSKIG